MADTGEPGDGHAGLRHGHSTQGTMLGPQWAWLPWASCYGGGRQSIAEAPVSVQYSMEYCIRTETGATVPD